MKRNDPKKLTPFLRVGLLCLAALGAGVYLWFFPSLGEGIALANPEYAPAKMPWLIFLWLTALLCYAALALAWQIVGSIGRDQPFSRENARRFAIIARLALVDAALFFVGNVGFILLNWSHPGVFLLSLLVDFVGLFIAAACEALAHLVLRAAGIQEENDLTI